MTRTLILAAALLGASATAFAAPVPAPGFDPLAFFTGTSHGEGTLKVALKSTVPLHVESHGRADGHGGIILDQVVHEGAKPATRRRWQLRRTSPTTLAGTLTEASGPVSGRVAGNQLLLAYPMKGGLKAEQVLTLQPDGRELANHMTVRKFGLVVGTINELITKAR